MGTCLACCWHETTSESSVASQIDRFADPFRLVRITRPELLDLPEHDPSELAGNLADLVRVNRWLGGSRLTIRGLETLTEKVPEGAPLVVLDVGTGAADVPRALVQWGQRRGHPTRVIGTDASAEILDLARGKAPDSVELAVAEGRYLPVADRAVDACVCSLVLHHLGPNDAAALLREMKRVSRLGIVVNDLVRSWFGYFGALALAHLATRNRLTRNDAPLSVRRAYTLPELRGLMATAGAPSCRAYHALGYRVALVAEVEE